MVLVQTNKEREWGIMRSQYFLIKKLQTGLFHRGYIVIINSQQIVGDSGDKLIKIYSLKHGGEEIIRSSSTIKLVKYLAGVNKVISKYPEVLEMDEREQNTFMESKGCLDFMCKEVSIE